MGRHKTLTNRNLRSRSVIVFVSNAKFNAFLFYFILFFLLFLCCFFMIWWFSFLLFVLFSGTMGNGVQIYDTRQSGDKAKPIWSLKTNRDVRASVNSMAWSPNGNLLACGCESGLTYLWDVRHQIKEMAVLNSQEKNPVQVRKI